MGESKDKNQQKRSSIGKDMDKQLTGVQDKPSEKQHIPLKKRLLPPGYVRNAHVPPNWDWTKGAPPMPDDQKEQQAKRPPINNAQLKEMYERHDELCVKTLDELVTYFNCSVSSMREALEAFRKKGYYLKTTKARIKKFMDAIPDNVEELKKAKEGKEKSTQPGRK